MDSERMYSGFPNVTLPRSKIDQRGFVFETLKEYYTFTTEEDKPVISDEVLVFFVLQSEAIIESYINYTFGESFPIEVLPIWVAITKRLIEDDEIKRVLLGLLGTMVSTGGSEGETTTNVSSVQIETWKINLSSSSDVSNSLSRVFASLPSLYSNDLLYDYTTVLNRYRRIYSRRALDYGEHCGCFIRFVSAI